MKVLYRPHKTELLDFALEVHVFRYSTQCQVKFHVCLFVLLVLLVVGFIHIKVYDVIIALNVELLDDW